MAMFHILIVDDNTVFHETVRNVLLSRFPSLHISEADDADTALAVTEQHTPDVIFMDIQLPGESGLQLTRKIHATHPATVIIVITSFDLPEYHEAAFDSGADYFFSKNRSNIQNLMEALESALYLP